MLSVFVEATFVLSLAVGALIAGTTDLRGIVAGTAGAGVWGSPALALGAVAFAFVVDRRDRTPAGRQPRYASGAHDDPRGAVARVRGPRSRLPAMGRRRAALARARARRAGLSPASERRVAAARRPSRSRSSCSARRSRSSRRCSRRCASCSCRGCSPSARSLHCSGSRPGSRDRCERRAPLDARRDRLDGRGRPAAIGRRRARDGAGARPRRLRALRREGRCRRRRGGCACAACGGARGAVPLARVPHA